MQAANNIGKASARSCILIIEDGGQTSSTSTATTRPLAIQRLYLLLAVNPGCIDDAAIQITRDTGELRERQYWVWQTYAHRDRKLGHCHQNSAEQATGFGEKVVPLARQAIR